MCRATSTTRLMASSTCIGKIAAFAVSTVARWIGTRWGLPTRCRHALEAGKYSTKLFQEEAVRIIRRGPGALGTAYDLNLFVRTQAAVQWPLVPLSGALRIS